MTTTIKVVITCILVTGGLLWCKDLITGDANLTQRALASVIIALSFPEALKLTYGVIDALLRPRS